MLKENVLCRLAGEPKTQDRIAHFLKTGKPSKKLESIFLFS